MSKYDYKIVSVAKRSAVASFKGREYKITGNAFSDFQDASALSTLRVGTSLESRHITALRKNSDARVFVEFSEVVRTTEKAICVSIADQTNRDGEGDYYSAPKKAWFPKSAVEIVDNRVFCNANLMRSKVDAIDITFCE